MGFGADSSSIRPGPRFHANKQPQAAISSKTVSDQPVQASAATTAISDRGGVPHIRNQKSVKKETISRLLPGTKILNGRPRAHKNMT